MFSIFSNSPALLMTLIYTFILINSFRPHFLISLSMLLGNFLPLFFNDFIFPVEYMSDQFRYLQCSIEIRESLSCSESSQTVFFASHIFAFFPVPIIDSVYSLGFINRIIYLIMIHILLKQYSKNFSILLILTLYLSVLMYSSLALRDNLIMVSFVFFSLAIIKGNLFHGLIITLIIFGLKPLLVVPAVVIIIFYSLPDSVRHKSLKLRWISLWLLAVGGFYFAFQDIILLALNAYRLSSFGEDRSSLLANYTPVTNLIFELAEGVFRFWFSPTILQATNSFQLLIAFENIIVFLIFIIKLCKSKENKSVYFAVSILMLAGSILSVAVINEGALTRYVYPLKVVIFIFLFQRFDISKRQSVSRPL